MFVQILPGLAGSGRDMISWPAGRVRKLTGRLGQEKLTRGQ